MPKLTDEKIDAILDEDIWHSAVMLRTDTPETEGAPGCWFGGLPTFPESEPWPMRSDCGIEYPLLFLLQINCRELPYLEGEPVNIPRHGYFFVFFDPINLGQLHGVIEETARLIYVEQDCSTIASRQCPPIPEMPDHEVDHRYTGETQYRRWPFNFIPVERYKLRRSIVEDLTGREKEKNWDKYMDRLADRRIASLRSNKIEINSVNQWLPAPENEENNSIHLLNIISEQSKLHKPIGFSFGDSDSLKLFRWK